MSMKAQGKKTYRTANGKRIDLDQLIARNELTPAVGNARVNARGDEIGGGGKIVRKREEILKDYYNNSKGMPNEAVVQRPADTKKDSVNDWSEDDEGNFIKKESNIEPNKQSTNRKSNPD